MTSMEIRQSFLDFFREKQHTIVPSSSLLPASPNLLFTNAGMNQFVPIFLGQQSASWKPPRVADTQKCIRAGGKHNDLDDVGLDTYHHTFFEMLGNWSFGDYFKKEAIDWAWELVVERWGLPPERLYATVYKPGEGEPSEFDQEAHDHWARLFVTAGLDPAVQIVNGNKKDNFWMMGDTGPCGPCSELHIDLTPEGETRGSLVNQSDPRCIEIWNLVFIQFNANADGTFAPLPQRHVDTGMGFERVTAMIQGTKNLTDFSRLISNYETDVFRPIFDEIGKLSGKRYRSTLPSSVDWGAHATGVPVAATHRDLPSRALPAVGGMPPEVIDASPITARASRALPSDEQVAMDVAFRVIADHIRTLSFAVADGIQPSNEGRGYVLRRILRRAVRYGRILGFHEPFFYKLVDVLGATMSDVFPELRTKQQLVRDTLRREEESFNRTLDKGIALFEAEAQRLLGSARDPRAVSSDSPETSPGARYSKRHLPHFERPWGKYAVTFSTEKHKPLSDSERDIVLRCLLFPSEHSQIELYVACVMPDHVHLLFEPQIKENNSSGNPVFWSLTELLQKMKSVSAHEINKKRGSTGPVWEKESFDRLIRSEHDLQEKFDYIRHNPWESGVARADEEYRWLWAPDQPSAAGGSPAAARESRALPGISAHFAFRLYDEQGFPLDLTELMARERGLSVDTAGFEKLMEEQRARARAAQKKTTIELAETDGKTATHFLGYDHDHTSADVQEVTSVNGRAAVVLNNSVCYAEMGGQVGDTGELRNGDKRWQIMATRKAGNTWLHLLDSEVAPVVGEHVTVRFEAPRRRAIERHHTVTHLLHWALHEVVSREAAQKGSYVGPEKLTFDFNSAPLTPEQIRDVEKLVNERIVENAPVSWIEIPYQEVKGRPEIMQFFGDKYGDRVRVVQIGGEPRALNGYSMELCGGTHVRGTGEIGLLRIVSEAAIAAGVRRVEAIAGLQAYDSAKRDLELIKSLADKLNSPITDLEKRIDSMLAQQKALEKSMKALEQKQAGETARELTGKVENIGDTPAIIVNVGAATGDQLQTIADALKQQQFGGVAVLGGAVDGNVALIATVGPQFTALFQAGKIIQAIAPIVGGKGGGRPDSARGAGKDASKLDAALAHARSMLAA